MIEPLCGLRVQATLTFVVNCRVRLGPRIVVPGLMVRMGSRPTMAVAICPPGLVADTITFCAGETRLGAM